MHDTLIDKLTTRKEEILQELRFIDYSLGLAGSTKVNGNGKLVASPSPSPILAASTDRNSVLAFLTRYANEERAMGRVPSAVSAIHRLALNLPGHKIRIGNELGEIMIESGVSSAANAAGAAAVLYRPLAKRMFTRVSPGVYRAVQNAD